MITGIAHLCFVVQDLERSVSFYCDQLGLTPGFDYHNEHGEWYGKYIHVGQRTFIELFKADVGPPVPAPSYRHVCLEVDDLEGTVAELRSSGVEVSEPELGKDRSWQAWLTDPDGNQIELHQYTRESKQGEYL